MSNKLPSNAYCRRNIACIACGNLRTGLPSTLSADATSSQPSPVAAPSPRFAGMFNAPQGHFPVSPMAPTGPISPGHPPQPALSTSVLNVPHKAPPPQYPPLTPSGRALSVGGRVRNISRDPLSPCVMYWPDNEPLPEPCQIRPIDSALMTVGTRYASAGVYLTPSHSIPLSSILVTKAPRRSSQETGYVESATTITGAVARFARRVIPVSQCAPPP